MWRFMMTRNGNSGGWSRTWILILCLIGGYLPELQAAPFSKIIQATQSDGTTVNILGRGDEFYAVFETLDGYTAVFDDQALSYCFAQRTSTDDRLVSSGKQIHLFSGDKLGLQKHLRAGKEEVNRQVSARRSTWESQMKPTFRSLAPRPLSLSKLDAGSGKTLVQTGLCLLVDFDDDPATIPQAEIAAFRNGTNYTGYGNNGSVREYFQYNSNGKMDYRDVVTVYVRIPNSVHPKSWYDDPSKSDGEQGNYLVRDALDILKSLPDYESVLRPAFASLTLDNKKEVVACNVFYAGKNRGVWGRGLWAHSYGLAITGPQELWPSGPKINRYQISEIGSELSLGTFCHENGHMLCGFPDIYDYGYDSVGGAGSFCIMNSGISPKNPVQFCAYLKLKAGWATASDLMATTSGTLAFEAHWGPKFNRFYRLNKPGIESEYYLLECRDKSGHDQEIPGSGIAVWHIDEYGNRDDQSLEYNTTHQNYQVSLVQADAMFHLEKNQNYGDDRDLFYEGNPASSYSNAFTDTSVPPARWWDGNGTRLALNQFSKPGPAMTLDFRIEGVPTDDAPFIVYQPEDALVAPGASINLSVTALGAQPIACQWYKDGLPLDTQTSPSLTLSNIGIENIGEYFLVASNQMGTSTSHIAQVSLALEQSRIDFNAYAYTAVKSNNLVYVTASNGSLNILDMTDPTRPRRTGRFLTAKPTIGCALSSKYAYVGSQGDGLLVFDISDPLDPQLISNCYSGADARGVTLRNSFAYVADIHAGLVIFDLADPIRPRKTGANRVSAINKMERLTVDDRYAYLACREGGLQIFDVSNPYNPQFAGGYDTDGIAVGVTVADGLAYVADETQGFKIIDANNIDVKNPGRLTLIGRGLTRFAKYVAVGGHRAYVADFSEGLVVFDVSDPRNPRRIGAFAVTGNAEMVFIDGDLIHMVNGYGGLLTLKILSQPDPSVLRWVNQPASRIVPAGTNLVLSAQAVGARPIAYQWLHDGMPIQGAISETLNLDNVQGNQAGVYSLEARNAFGEIISKPAKLDIITRQGSIAMGDAVGVSVRGSYAYVCAGKDGLTVVDISDPTHMQIVGKGQGGDGIAIERIALGDRYAFTASGAISTYDLKDPINPVCIGISTEKAFDLSVGGGRAMLHRDAGYIPLDISSPNAPKPFWNTLHGAWYRSRIDGNLFYAGEHNSESLKIFDISNPGKVWHVGDIKFGSSTGMTLGEGYALVPSLYDGMLVCDIGNPRLPIWLSQPYLDAGTDMGVVWHQGMAFVAVDSQSDITVYDLSDPQMPVSMDKLAKGVGGSDIAADGDKICLANRKNGLLVIELASHDNRPKILRQPEDRTFSVGDSVELSMDAQSVEGIAYQWYFNQQPLSGATNASLVIHSLVETNQGYYQARARNRWGETRSRAVRLDAMLAPRITAQPNGGTVETSTAFKTRVAAVGMPPLTYQWFKDGSPIIEEEGESFTIDSVVRSHAGTYSVRIQNEYGVVESNPFHLDVTFNALERIWKSTGSPFAFDVATTPDYVLIAARWDNISSQIFDLSDPKVPKIISTIPEDAYGIEAVGHRAYLACDGNGLRIYDFSILESPKLLGSIKTVGNAMDVAVSGAFAYVAVGIAGVEIIDIQNPEHPVSVGVCDTPGNARKLTVAGQYLYVADREGGLQILDIKVPSQTQIVGAFTTGAISVGITVVNDQAYLTDDSGEREGNGTIPSGLRILNIADRTNPKLLGFLPSSFAKTSIISGRYALVADWADGLLMVDIGDPKNPFLVRRLETGLRLTEGVGVFGNQVCLANGDGLTVLNVEQLEPFCVNQPEACAVSIGATARFKANMAGADPFAYQWYFNGNPMPLATNQILELHGVQLVDAGSYVLEARNQYGTNRSSPGVLTVKEDFVVSAPVQDQIRYSGNDLTLDIAAYGKGPFTYQWFLDGMALKNSDRTLGAQEAKLYLSGVNTNDSGNYSVVVRCAGSTTSNIVAHIWIPAPGQLAWKRKGVYWGKAAVDDSGTLYLGSGYGFLQAIDGRSGSVIWEYSMAKPGENGVSYRFTTAPVLDGHGTIYAASNENGFIYALDQKSGAVKWRLGTESRLVGCPALDVARGQLYCVSADGVLYAVDVVKQHILWSYEFIGFFGDENANPVVGGDGTVYVASMNGMLHALNPHTGKVLWRTPFDRVVTPFPALSSYGRLYLSGQAFDVDTGRRSWNAKAGRTTLMSTTSDLYTLDESALLKIDGNTGNINWRTTPPATGTSVPILGQDGILYFGGEDKKFYACEGQQGKTLWTYPVGEELYHTTPIFGPEGLVYFTPQFGSLYAIQTSSRGLANSDWPCYRRNALNQACLPQKAVVSQSPPSQTLKSGMQLKLSVQAFGDAPLFFQWFRDGMPLEGATNGAYQLESCGFQDAGLYSVTVSNALAVASSTPCNVEIKDAVPPYILWKQPENGDWEVSPGNPVSILIANRDSSADPGSIRMKINGQPVDSFCRVTSVPQGLRIDYEPHYLPPNQTYRVELSFQDNQTPANVSNCAWSFTTLNIPCVDPVNKVSENAKILPGFNGRSVQGWLGKWMENSARGADAMLTNSAPFHRGSGVFPYINFDSTSIGRSGLFLGVDGYKDIALKSTRLLDSHQEYIENSFTLEFTGYLQLKAGINRLGFFADDGFKCEIVSENDTQSRILLGQGGSGGGGIEKQFDVFIADTGLYPVRLVFWNVFSSSSIEFYSVDRKTGRRSLINDLYAIDGIPAFRNPQPFEVDGYTPVAVISSAPPNRIISKGSDLTLPVLASGTGTLAYQWLHQETNLVNRGAIDGVNTAELIIRGITTNESGTYYAQASDPYNLITSSAMNISVVEGENGFVVREVFNGINGNTVKDLTSNVKFSNSKPDWFDALTWFEDQDGSDSSGERVSGFITAPSSGFYTFYIASDDESELWLSPDDHSDNKTLIAHVIGNAGFRQYTATASQISTPIRLAAGARYYIEALAKQATGAQHLSVAWKQPGETTVPTVPIPGQYLSPYYHLNNDICIWRHPEGSTVPAGTNVVLSVVASSFLPMSYQWRWKGMDLADGTSIQGTASRQLLLSNIQASDAGPYSVVVSTGNMSITSSVARITVRLQPTAVAQTLTMNEDTSLSFGLQGIDADRLPLFFTVIQGPKYGTLIGTPPDLTYIPQKDYDGSDEFTFIVSNNRCDSLPATMTIVVQPVNDPPVLSVVGNKTVNEGNELRFQATATDSDIPAQKLTFTLDAGAPQGAIITADGLFTWTPTSAQVPSTNQVTIRVSDGVANVSETVTVVANPIAEVSGGLLAWYPLDGNAKDASGNGHHGSVSSTMPTIDRFGNPNSACYFNGDAYVDIPSFLWTNRQSISLTIWVKPDQPYSGSYQDIVSKHSGGGNVQALIRTGPDGKYYCQWDVGSQFISTSSAPPSGGKYDLLVLSYDGAFARFWVNTNQTAAVAATGDIVSNSLPYTLGAKANDRNSEKYRGCLDDFRIYSRALSRDEIILLYKSHGMLNHTPVLSVINGQIVNEGQLLSFAANASDSDLPAQELTFTLDAGAPLGAGITADGLFTWTPTEAQGPGTNQVTIRVSDGVASASQTMVIVVNEINLPPVLSALGNKAVDEGSELRFQATATDSDLPAQKLSFTLEAGAPQGAVITADGLFAWTPSEAQGPGTNQVTIRVSDGVASVSQTMVIVVNEINLPPVLLALGNKTVDEGSELRFQATATDSDLPAQKLSFTLDAGAPQGAVITADGLFAWTPSEAQGPGTNQVTIRVSDGVASVSQTIAIVVNEINLPPVLLALGNKTVDEGSELRFQATATDSDLPAQTLTFTLDAGAPQGAVITADGLFAWTPSEAQGPGTNQVTIRVSDGVASVSQTIAIVVNEVNLPPVLWALGNKTVDEGSELRFQATATDSDLPAQTLTFTLDAWAPQGAVITADGLFTWTPSEAQGPGTNQVTIRVSDGVASVSQTMAIVVNEIKYTPMPSRLRGLGIIQGRFHMQLEGQTGLKYSVQSSVNLLDWVDLLITNAPSDLFYITDTNDVVFPRRFYRALQRP